MTDSENLQQEALASVQELYKKCARLLISLNVTERQYAQMCRRSFIEDLIDQYRNNSDDINYRDIERITGLNRQTAEKVASEIENQTPIVSSKNACATTLAYWKTHASIYEKKIPLKGKNSFKQLCNSALRDINSAGYKSVLNALIDYGSITFDMLNQEVVLVNTFPLYKNISKTSLDFAFRTDLAYHADTVVGNLLATDGNVKLDRIYKTYNVPKELQPKLEHELASICKDALKKAENFIQQECETKKEHSAVIGMGTFLFKLPWKV